MLIRFSSKFAKYRIIGSFNVLFLLASFAARKRFSKLIISSYMLSRLARRSLSGPAFVSASCQRPWHPFFLHWKRYRSNAASGVLNGSETTTDVAVPVRPRVVEVQSGWASIASVVPVAATDR